MSSETSGSQHFQATWQRALAEDSNRELDWLWLYTQAQTLHARSPEPDALPLTNPRAYRSAATGALHADRLRPGCAFHIWRVNSWHTHG